MDPAKNSFFIFYSYIGKGLEMLLTMLDATIFGTVGMLEDIVSLI
jgi:hypothetical protein